MRLEDALIDCSGLRARDAGLEMGEEHDNTIEK
jgi:hypothetical protein